MFQELLATGVGVVIVALFFVGIPLVIGKLVNRFTKDSYETIQQLTIGWIVMGLTISLYMLFDLAQGIGKYIFSVLGIG